MVPRNEFLPTQEGGYRVPLRDPLGLAKWLRSQLEKLQEEHLLARSPARAQRGRPPELNLGLIAVATDVSVPVVSRLLSPLGPTAKRNRLVSLNTIRRLERLPRGSEVRRFILTPTDQARLDNITDPERGRLSEREANLWDSWEASNNGPMLRSLLQGLRSKEFSELEISGWRRWMMRPFLTFGASAHVSRQWEQLRRRERDRYLEQTTNCVREILSRRRPASVRLLESAATLDEDDFRAMMSKAFGITEPSAIERGEKVLALIDDSMSSMRAVKDRIADQHRGGEDGA